MKLKLLFSVLCVSLFVAACDNTADQSSLSAPDDSTSQIVDKKLEVSRPKPHPDWPTYMVVTETTYAPFEFKDKIGQPIGFEIDLIYAIAQKQKFNISVISGLRKNAEVELEQNKADIWVSAFEIGVDIDADYSNSLMDFARVVAVPKDSSIQTSADLNGKTIAFNANSSKDTMDKAASLVGSTGKIVEAETFILAIRNMQGGNADGVLGDINMLRYYDNDHSEVEFRLIDIKDPVSHIGFAVKKGNNALKDKLNKGLAEIRADGTYNKLVEKWFGK